MKFASLSCAVALALFCGSARAATFNYHGNLQETGNAANGSYDLELTLYSASDGGKVIAGPLQMFAVPVHEGSFSTQADFGVLTKVPDQAWLGVKVRKAGQTTFAALDARAPVGTEAVTAASCPGSWTLGGNAGNLAGSYIGTADNQPLTFKVNALTAGSITPGKGVAFGQSSASPATATGRSAFASGESVSASGIVSFAGGTHAAVAQDGSYMWGDSNFGSGATSTTAADQYIVRAHGGVGINTANGPKGTEPLGGAELTISSSGGYGHETWIDMLSASSAADVNRGFNLAATSSGTFALRKITNNSGTLQLGNAVVVDNAGVTINDPANLPPNNTADVAALRVLAPAGGADALIDMYPHDSANPTLSNYWSLLSDKSELDVIRTRQFDTSSAVSRTAYMKLFEGFISIPNVEITAELIADHNVNVAQDLSVSGAAYKPGGGSWAATSDRRIKQDIAPIGNAVNTLLKLKPVSFHYTPEYRAMENNLPDKPYLGFIAQEFRDVFPDAVMETAKHVPGAPANTAPILALDSSPALITAVAAVQELAVESRDRDAEVEKLRAENASIRADNVKMHSENAQMRTRLDSISARLDSLSAQRSQ
jgi:Chaperone of endosialidase